MSLWHDDLRIGIGAERIVCVRTRRGVRRRNLEQVEIPAEPVGSGPPWASSAGAMAEYLRAARRGSRVHIVLSNRLVRYASVPWNDMVISSEERRAQARHIFKQLYGDASAGWAVACSPGRYGKPYLATAVDTALLEHINSAAARARCSIQSVQPYLTAVHSAFAATFTKRDRDAECLCVVEPQQLTCIAFSPGTMNVLNRRIQGDWQAELAAWLLDGGVKTTEHPSLHVRAFAPEDKSAPDATGTVRYLSLPRRSGSGQSSDGQFAMALVGTG